MMDLFSVVRCNRAKRHFNIGALCAHTGGGSEWRLEDEIFRICTQFRLFEGEVQRISDKNVSFIFLPLFDIVGFDFKPENFVGLRKVLEILRLVQRGILRSSGLENCRLRTEFHPSGFRWRWKTGIVSLDLTLTKTQGVRRCFIIVPNYWFNHNLIDHKWPEMFPSIQYDAILKRLIEQMEMILT